MKKTPKSIRCTTAEMLAILNGEDLEAIRSTQAIATELTQSSEQYKQLPADKWPTLIFNWDHHPSSQHLALDGVGEFEFRKLYPEGLRLGRIPLSDFDHRLCHRNRRSLPEELWIGDEGKLAKTIEYLKRGLPITPPIVSAVNGQFFLEGGNHRYTAAKASGLPQLDIYVAHKNVAAVEIIYAIDWQN